MGKPVVRTSDIRNKIKRSEVYHKRKAEQKKAKKEEKLLREKEAKERGETVPKQIPRTLDNTREADDTYVDKDDPEVLGDEADDEFADIFVGETKPKLMLTTKIRPSGKVFHIMRDLLTVLPNCFYYKRGSHELRKICKWAANKKFTHLLVVCEKKKQVNGLIVIRLPCGPTAFFKLSSFKFIRDIYGHGNVTNHSPLVLMNRFDTRLGRRLSRVLGSMYSPTPQKEGRRVITFHNQRDFVFVRQHRYVYESKKKARLQELGPRFTLKLRWLLADAFNTVEGEYEWVHKRHLMDTSRRKFHL